MTEFPIDDHDRSVIFDPGETEEVLHQLLDIISIQACLVRPTPPSFYVPLAILWHPSQDALEVIFANQVSGEGIQVIYRLGRTTRAVLRPAEESAVPDLAAAIDALRHRSPAGCFWASCNDCKAEYWRYERGDWADKVVSARKDFEYHARSNWLRTHPRGNPPAFVSWMDRTVAALNSADES
jgi:hypothetical protein